MTGTFMYLSYPHPFQIAAIKSGYYAGGQYYMGGADQFVSKQTIELYRLLSFEDWRPNPFPPRTCKSCAKTCHNLTVTGDCCDYEPMLGLHVVSFWRDQLADPSKLIAPLPGRDYPYLHNAASNKPPAHRGFWHQLFRRSV
jgi:hypothetical protein